MHTQLIRTFLLGIALTASSGVLSAATLYKVTGTIGAVTSHNTADFNVPEFGDFNFYFGTGAIPDYVAPGSLEGDFSTGFVSLGYLRGLLDVTYDNPSDNGFALQNRSERSIWDPSENTLTLQIDQATPNLQGLLVLQFAPGFTGNGPAIVSDSYLRLVWLGRFLGQPQLIQAQYGLDSVSVSAVSDGNTVVPEPSTAVAGLAGILLIAANRYCKRLGTRCRWRA